MLFSPSEYLVYLYGSEQAVAKKLNRTQAAINGWRKRDHIPSAAQKQVLEVTKADGLDYTVNDIIHGRDIPLTPEEAYEYGKKKTNGRKKRTKR